MCDGERSDRRISHSTAGSLNSNALDHPLGQVGYVIIWRRDEAQDHVFAGGQIQHRLGLPGGGDGAHAAHLLDQR